jgi:hypothetical protein
MKIKDIINQLDKSGANMDENANWDLQNMGYDLGLNCNVYSQKQDDLRMKCYWLSIWTCTDTNVGTRAYFLDGMLVCISQQFARKSDETFEWVDESAVIATRNFIFSLQEQEDESDVKYLDLDQEVGVGFNVNFTGQLHTDKVIYEGSRAVVLEDNEYTEMPWGKKACNFHTLLITNEYGTRPVDIQNCVIPWHTTNGWR